MDSTESEKTSVDAGEVRYVRLTWVLFIFTISVFIITIAIYAFNFSGTQLSSASGDWGTFGDFLGGVLNPIVGLINMAFVMLTLRQNHKALNQNAEEIRLATSEAKQAREAQQGMLGIEKQNLSDRNDLLKVESLKKELDVRLSNLEKELARKQIYGDGTVGLSISDVVAFLRRTPGSYHVINSHAFSEYYPKLFNEIMSVNDRLLKLSSIERGQIGFGYQYRIVEVMDEVYEAVSGFSYPNKEDPILDNTFSNNAWANFCVERERLRNGL